MAVVESIECERRLVALTFDDGPGPDTGSILDALGEAGAAATFFVLGASLDGETAAIVARAAAAGHEIGNHTHSHLSFLDVPYEDTIREEILWCHRRLTALTGREPELVRPPYGHALALVDAVAGPLGYRATVGWSLDAEDWREPPAEETAARLLEAIRPGSIVLLHDGWPPGEAPASRARTAEAVRLLLPELDRRGFEPVTVSQLLDA